MPESADQRHNRELIELLNELRVALPGVQVLFAFPFAVPFANGFPKLERFDRDVFYAAFVAAVLSTVLLILLLWYGLPLGAAIRDFRRSPRAR